jgi:hypothetical protein
MRRSGSRSALMKATIPSCATQGCSATQIGLRTSPARRARARARLVTAAAPAQASLFPVPMVRFVRSARPRRGTARQDTGVTGRCSSLRANARCAYLAHTARVAAQMKSRVQLARTRYGAGGGVGPQHRLGASAEAILRCRNQGARGAQAQLDVVLPLGC